DRNESRKGTWRQRQSFAGGVSREVPRICRALRRTAQERLQAAGDFWAVERSLSDDEFRLRSRHRRGFSRFHGEGLRLSRQQAGVLVHSRRNRSGGGG